MFGITENGDASIDYTWVDKLNEVDGAILITKKLTDKFCEKVLEHIDENIIIHASCTGYGKTVLEPNLYTYQETIQKIKGLINSGFPSERIVLRVDPIIPTEKGIRIFQDVIKYSREIIPDVHRIRISVIDMYPHVRQRFLDNDLPCPYGNNFQANKSMFLDLNKKIEELKEKYPELSFESCAETNIPAASAVGCVSVKDYEILGLEKPDESKKGQRKNCLCLGDKKDLLKYQYQKTGYNHCYGCLYCYWKTELD